MTPGQKRKPRFKRAPAETPNIRIQERDAEIIRHVFRHRCLTSEHIRALIPGHSKDILRRLQQLYHSGYLDRPREQVNPYQPGSRPMVYALGNKGADLLMAEYGIKRGKVDWTSKNREVKRVHLEHTLQVADFMVKLELAVARAGNIRLTPQEEILSHMPGAKKGAPLPMGWKVNYRPSIAGQTRPYRISLRPDKVFGLHFPDQPKGRQKAWFFLEADRSTMPVIRTNLNLSSFYKKLAGYRQSRLDEAWLRIFGFRGARVLTLAKSAERIRSMIRANQILDPEGLGFRMFLFARADRFDLENPSRVLEPVWVNGRGERVGLT